MGAFPNRIRTIAMVLVVSGLALFAPALLAEEAPIGSARLEPDGTLVLWLRAEGEDGSIVGHGELRYAPGDPDYGHVLRHLGPIPPGGEVLVRPFPPVWPDEPARPQR